MNRYVGSFWCQNNVFFARLNSRTYLVFRMSVFLKHVSNENNLQFTVCVKHILQGGYLSLKVLDSPAIGFSPGKHLGKLVDQTKVLEKSFFSIFRFSIQEKSFSTLIKKVFEKMKKILDNSGKSPWIQLMFLQWPPCFIISKTRLLGEFDLAKFERTGEIS